MFKESFKSLKQISNYVKKFKKWQIIDKDFILKVLKLCCQYKAHLIIVMPS